MFLHTYFILFLFLSLSASLYSILLWSFLTLILCIVNVIPQQFHQNCNVSFLFVFDTVQILNFIFISFSINITPSHRIRFFVEEPVDIETTGKNEMGMLLSRRCKVCSENVLDDKQCIQYWFIFCSLKAQEDLTEKMCLPSNMYLPYRHTQHKSVWMIPKRKFSSNIFHEFKFNFHRM